MLYETIVTTFFRGIPEAFMHMFAIYAFSGIDIDKNKYIKSSMILSLLLVFIRALPISYGIHTILVVMSIIGLAVLINKVSVVFAISTTIIDLIIQFIAEGINIILIERVFNRNLSEIMSRLETKMIYGIPSLIIFYGSLYLVYKYRRRKKNVENA